MWFCLTTSLATLFILHSSTASSYSSQEAPPPSTKSKSASFLVELILKNDCFAKHDSLQAISICLKTKLLGNLNELIRSNKTIEISNFDLVKTNSLAEVDNSLDESLNEIPVDVDERSLGGESSQLTRMILKRAWQFLQTRSVRLNTDSNDDNGVDDEGRKKKDKGGSMMVMMAMGMGGMMMKMMMGKVALIAMKALIIGKIALILSGIMALKKLMQQGGGGGGGHESSGHGSSDWSSRRIYEDNSFGSDMAYSAFAPTLVTRK